jgi:serine/threonine protein kinase
VKALTLTDAMVKRLTDAPSYAVAGRFELGEEAGAGGMGTVYRARDRETGADVALKVLRHDGIYADRFEREAELLARLDHPAIVRYVTHGTTEEGDRYLVMEWLDGISLGERLGMAPPPSLRDAVVVGREVAGALATAHAAGIIHRDLKPSNLMLVDGRFARLKVLDFGIARPVAAPGDSAPEVLTHTGQLIGTPGYMAPEQARGDKNVDARADLFALGCVLFRLVAQRPAFEGDDVLSLLGKLATEVPPRVSEIVDGVPSELDELIARMLSKAAADRPASAAEVEATLATLLATLDAEAPAGTEVLPKRRVDPKPTISTHPPSVSEPVNASSRLIAPAPRRSKLWLVLVAAAVVLAIGAALKFGRDREEPTASAASQSAVAPSAPSANRAELQSSAAQVCRVWSAALARGQKEDGSFSLEAHRQSTLWDTAQQLTPLAFSLRTCGGNAQPVRAAIAAMAKFPIAEASSGALAWATLGLSFSRVSLDDPALERVALEMRERLLKHQRPDGSFRLVATPDVTNDYATLLAIWALVEVDGFDKGAASEATGRALDYLRQRLENGSTDPMRSVSGLADQAAFTFVYTRPPGPARPDEGALVRGLAREVVQRCALSASPTEGCTHPIAGEDGIVMLEEGTETARLTTLWHPWATVAATALSTEPAVAADPELARELERVSGWGVLEMQRGSQFIGVAPAYKLADYLLASMLLLRNEPASRRLGRR